MTEPEPGRVPVETDLGRDVVTTFIVEPVHGGGRARATISTEMGVGGRPLGWLRRRLVSRFLRTVYTRQIAHLEAAAAGRATG